MFLATIGLGVLIVLALNMTVLRDLARVVVFGSRNEGDKSKPIFDPAQNIRPLTGKVILIMGAAGDLGRQTAIELARYGRPARIYIADLPSEEDAKNLLAQRILHEAYGEPDPGTDMPQRTVIKFLDLDLSAFRSIQKCAAEFIAQEDRLDALILNAGVLRAVPALTPEGYEVHFGVNYLGHALLSRLLIPTLLSTLQMSSDVRVVVVSSEGHHAAPVGGIDFAKVKTDCAELVRIRRTMDV
jgi:retinol dehydrogenase 12